MCIYKITNKINGKSYIGQTNNDLNIRFKQHCQKSSKCTALNLAIQKYGKDNFIIEEIDGANSQSELNYKEWLLVFKYNSLAPNGYNLLHGGGSRGKMSNESIKRLSNSLKGRISPNKGKIFSEEHKLNLSKSHLHQESYFKGKIFSEEHKHNISVSKKGIPNSMIGKTHTEQSKKNMSLGSIGQKSGMINKKHTKKSNLKNAISNGGGKKFIVNKGKDIVWIGFVLSECARTLNLSIGNISECLHKKRITHKGYTFSYEVL